MDAIADALLLITLASGIMLIALAGGVMIHATAMINAMPSHAEPMEAKLMPQAQRVITTEVIVAAPRADVWHAFTTTEGVTTFFARSARIDLRRGGAYEIYFATDEEPGSLGSEGCRVLSFVEGEMLSFTWNAPPPHTETRWHRTFVVVRLADADEGKTRVPVTHAGWQEGDAWDGTYAYFDRAWGGVLANLVKRFDEGPLWPEEERLPLTEPLFGKTYCYFIPPARDGFFEKMTPRETEALGGHVAYVQSLLAAGRLILAGPCFDPAQYPSGEETVQFEIPAPGIVVFRAADDADARAMMDADPVIAAGVFKAQVNRLDLAFLEDMAGLR